MLEPRRFIAIDWSGRKKGAHRAIWTAVYDDGAVELCSNKTRDEVIEYVLELIATEPRSIVGIDFAFSLPKWFLDDVKIANRKQFYEYFSETNCEAILAGRLHAEHFWGKNGKPRPLSQHPSFGKHLRETEQNCVMGSSAAKPVFQIGGAGSVGTGTLRGLPYLKKLHNSGVSIWPFDRASLPMAVEIYPRLLTGKVVKSSREERERYLVDSKFARMPSEVLQKAEASEDAFDALVSVVVMAEYACDFASLPEPCAENATHEGWIWQPPQR